jgi:predicted SnoaL-like aldol condensation-catalyzing enzyme
VEKNPYDPWKRTDLSANEKAMLDLMTNCMHGDDLSLIDRYVAEDYIQHTPGIGQGREGLYHYISTIAFHRPGRKQWRPIQLFACGNFVILHKLLSQVVIVDIMRFNEKGLMAEHWDVVQALPEPNYDPMKKYEEDFTRFYEMFSMAKV